MPRIYQKKSNIQSWSKESMTAAITEMLSGKPSYREIAALHQVPPSTLYKKALMAKNENLSPIQAAEKGLLGNHRTVFTEAQEKEIVQLVLTKGQRLFDETGTSDLREFAFRLAESNNIPHPFNRETQRAGADWLNNFLDKYKELSSVIAKKSGKIKRKRPIPISSPPEE